MKRKSLKTRIIVTIVLIVTLTSTLFGAALLLMKQRLEEATFGNMVADQLQVLLTQPDPQALLANPMFKDWRFYSGQDIASLPAAVRALPEGSHHSVRMGEGYYHVEVDRWQQQPVYLIYDVSEWEEQEHALLEALVYGVCIILIAAIFMGARASRTILSPIRELTARVSGIQPGQRKVRLGSDFEGTEIDQIANAVDVYLERLDEFVEREQSFTAAASHELRTPLAVMMGAVDVLDANPQTAPSSRALKRIQRACAEMLAFIEATLFLSREEASAINQSPPANIESIIESLLEDNKSKLKECDIALKTAYHSILIINQPQSIIQITLGNILRNAIEHNYGGKIDITLSAQKLVIADTGEGIPEDKLPYIFDRTYTTKAGGTGMGLNLVKRICDRFGWEIEVLSTPGQGTSVTLVFPEMSKA